MPGVEHLQLASSSTAPSTARANARSASALAIGASAAHRRWAETARAIAASVSPTSARATSRIAAPVDGLMTVNALIGRPPSAARRTHEPVRRDLRRDAGLRRSPPDAIGCRRCGRTRCRRTPARVHRRSGRPRPAPPRVDRCPDGGKLCTRTSPAPSTSASAVSSETSMSFSGEHPSAEAVPFGAERLGEVLLESAAARHVDQLQPPADREHRDAPAARRPEQRQLPRVTVDTGGVGQRIAAAHRRARARHRPRRRGSSVHPGDRRIRRFPGPAGAAAARCRRTPSHRSGTARAECRAHIPHPCCARSR